MHAHTDTHMHTYLWQAVHTHTKCACTQAHTYAPVAPLKTLTQNVHAHTCTNAHTQTHLWQAVHPSFILLVAQQGILDLVFQMRLMGSHVAPPITLLVNALRTHTHIHTAQMSE